MGKRKRNHGGEISSPTTAPNPPDLRLKLKLSSGPQALVLSSNWLQLQATLGKPTTGSKAWRATKTSEAAMTSTFPSGDGKKIVEAPISLIPSSSDFSITRVLALDCEMVGVGSEGKRSALARVSVVNEYGNVVYDKHVRPPEFVTDFRTQVSGVRPGDLRKAEDFFTVQREVSDFLKGCILIGHALHNDLKVLLLSHPRKDIRDTQLYRPFRGDRGRPQALKNLAALHLGVKIQQREHDSIEDARAALCLYQRSKEAWEDSLRQNRKRGRGPKTHDKPKRT